MKKFMIEMSFINKPKETKTIENTDNLTALTYSLNALSLEEKNNIIGVKVKYMEELRNEKPNN